MKDFEMNAYQFTYSNLVRKGTIKVITFLFILLISIFDIQVIYGQNYADARPGQLTMTPDASALFKSTDIPVNLSTGVPNISIPIYTIELNGFSLPIGLNYNSSGLRVDEISSNVGLGWSLQAGGMISSAVNGRPDFGQNGYLHSGLSFPQSAHLSPFKTLLFGGVYESNEDYDLLFEASGKPVLEYTGSSSTSYGTSSIDTQPDLFYYNIAGLSGKFFLNRSYDVFTVPFQPIHVQWSSGGNGFTIVDESGNLYEFLITETIQIETSVFAHPRFGAGSSTVENTNYLISRIVTAKGDELVFEYENMSYTYLNAPFYTRYRLMGNNHIGDWPLNVEARYETKNYIFGKRLKKITTTSNVEVYFEYSSCERLDLSKSPFQTGAFALESIRIDKNDDIQIVSFTQDYINFSGSNPCNASKNEDLYRLRLKEVHFPGKPPYVFEYFDSNEMPSRFSEFKDHWGYFSNNGGKYFNEPQFGFSGQSKAPSLTGTLKGVLSKIEYPTGGFSTFEYELNRAEDAFTVQNVNIQPQGVFIEYDNQNFGERSINFELTENYNIGSFKIQYNTTQGPAQAGYAFDVSLSGPNNYFQQFTSVTGYDMQELALPFGTYTLTVNQQGEFLEGFVQLNWTITTVETEEVQGEVLLGGLRIKQVNSFDGQNMQPALVKKYEYLDENGKSSGKNYNRFNYSYSTSKFNIEFVPTFSDISVNEVNYFAQNSSSVLPLSGLNGYHVMYTQVKEYLSGSNDNGYTLYKFSFTDDLQALLDHPRLNNVSFDWKRGLPIETSVFSFNELSSNYFLTKRTINKFKFNDSYNNLSAPFLDPFVTPVFPNENHILLYNIENVIPEIIVIDQGVHFRFYPAQFKYNISKIVSSWYYLESTTEEEFDPSGNQVLSQETKYYYDNPQHAQLTRKENYLSDGSIIKEFTLYPLDFGNNQAFINLLKSNKIINKPIEKVVVKDEGGKMMVKTGALYTYKNSGKGILDKVYSFEGENTHLSAFKFSNQPLGQMPGSSLGGNFQMDNNYKEKLQISLYNSRSNPLQVQYSNGMVSSYLWSYNEQLPIAKVENAYWGSIAFTSFETNDKGGWNYSGQPVSNVSAKTGNKCYNLSGGSISRSGIGASTNNPFKLSFWARSVSGNTNWVFMGQTEQLTTQWKLIERVVQGNEVTISGSNVLIDELRLHPQQAMMETYTHKPEIGIQTHTDVNNRTYYYQYDEFGRLKRVNDEFGNLLKENEYHYKGQ